MIRSRENKSLLQYILNHFFLSIIFMGCTTIPLSTIFSLSRVNFENTNLDEFRIAIRLPREIRPSRQGIKLDAILKVSNEKDFNTSYTLVPSFDASDEDPVLKNLNPLYITYILRISSPDISSLKELRKKAYDNRKQEKNVSLGFGISIKEFCSQNSKRDTPINITTFIKTSEIGKFIILTKEHDLKKDQDVKIELSKIKNCD